MYQQARTLLQDSYINQAPHNYFNSMANIKQKWLHTPNIFYVNTYDSSKPLSIYDIQQHINFLKPFLSPQLIKRIDDNGRLNLQNENDVVSIFTNLRTAFLKFIIGRMKSSRCLLLRNDQTLSSNYVLFDLVDQFMVLVETKPKMSGSSSKQNPKRVSTIETKSVTKTVHVLIGDKASQTNINNYKQVQLRAQQFFIAPKLYCIDSKPIDYLTGQVDLAIITMVRIMNVFISYV